MTEIFETVIRSFGNYNYPCIFVICILIGLVFANGKRKIFLIPAILITVAVLNPAAKRIMESADKGGVYWRTLWIVPVIPVCAFIPSFVVDKVKTRWLKYAVLAVSVSVFVYFGSIVYSLSSTAFYGTDTAEKLPDEVVAVGDALLALDEYPRAVTDTALSVYLRQYSGKIQLPYGRDAVYGALNTLGRSIYDNLVAGNYHALAQIMENHDYKYLVTDNQETNKYNNLIDAGYEIVDQIDKYGIYRTHGIRTEKREYNERGQVIRKTYVDTEGQPINSGNRYINGYATVIYDYDYAGRIAYEFYADAKGNGVPDSRGRAGFQYRRNSQGQIVRTTFLDENGYPIQNGCALVLYEYGRNNSLVKESYYDISGNAADFGIGYSVIERKYKDGQLSLSYFKDKNGKRLCCGSSFFHDYLGALIDGDDTIFISVKDEGTDALTQTLQDDLSQLGIKSNLLKKHRNSYYAVISSDYVEEALSDTETLQYSGEIGGKSFNIISGGFYTGNISSIVIDGKEYSNNKRGMNIVVYNTERNEVIDSITFDTCSEEMSVTR